MITGNKGEWSELYVFTKLLAEGVLYQSDINLNRDEENFYEIVKAYKIEKNKTLEYSRAEEISIYNATSEAKIFLRNLDINYFSENANLLLEGIRKGKGKNFTLENIEPFIEKIGISKLTAMIDSKSDLKLRIYDHRLAKETDLGFSIKSLLGKDSTLFNTGDGNNFIYEIENNLETSVETFNKETYKPADKSSKLTYRLQKIIAQKLTIKFSEIQSRQLWKNLKMIDGDLPEILSYSLLYRWIDKEKSLYEITKILEERDPLNFYDGERSEQKLYEYKIKKFLAECAMGMTSKKPWHGIYDATGGVIIAKKDGDIVCFHIYDFNLFREYLLHNTIFEQPSTGEDENLPGTHRTTKGTKKYYYGWLYEENNFLKYKINLQIRFK